MRDVDLALALDAAADRERGVSGGCASALTLLLPVSGVLRSPPNLHHRVFEEDTFWKVATGEYWPLPIPDLPYATNDGLGITVTKGAGHG